jgi:cytochrome c2
MADLVAHYQCGSCHEIPGIAGADGNVGPPLRRIGTRTYIAGFIRNSPDNMASWIEDPQKMLPGNAMPQMGISPDDARDIAAFLYTLR